MSTRSVAILDIVWGVLLLVLAIKWLPAIGVFGMVTIICAGIKIGVTGLQEVYN